MSDNKDPKGPKGNDIGKGNSSQSGKSVDLGFQRETIKINPGENQAAQEGLNKGFELRPIPEKPKK
jgi:hypothetical protein